MSDNQQSLQPSHPTTSEQAPSWRQLYLNAQREKGTERIKNAVITAEAAMFERWQELSELPGHTEERAQLQEASNELLAIKTYKLNWPNPSAGHKERL